MIEAIRPVMLVSKGSGKYAPKLLQASLLRFYASENLFPKGITEEMQAIQLWSLKMARALSRLVAWPKVECPFCMLL